MNAVLADLRQPTCTESLSPAMQGYLRDRVRAATGQHTPQRWDIKLYQCLGDARSAEALCEDLLDFVADNAQQNITGIVAVFECAPCGHSAPFAETLQRHLSLMQAADGRVTADGASSLDDDDVSLQIDGRGFKLLCMHADAERLSRVIPCPVLVFTAS